MDKLLQSFLVVAEMKSISKAAMSLNITSTALLKQINQLESRVGIKLFVRTHRGVSLTKAGQSFFQDTSFILDFFENAVEKAQRISKVYETIRVGSSIMSPANFLTRFLNKQIIKQFNLQVVPVGASLLTADIIFNDFGNHIDIVGDFYDDSILQKYHCKAVKLTDLDILVACAPNSGLSTRASLNLSDLVGKQINLFYPTSNECLQDLKQQLSNASCRIKEWPILTSEMFARLGDDELTITTKLWQNLDPFAVDIPLNVNLKLPYGIIYDQNPSDPVQTFINSL